ncbi:MAG: hypothetical protein M1821_001859 [Bathelium mastoideum]|nr:MAG: hypothetical protein M1821_001859 [Bathelium mastoideum]
MSAGSGWSLGDIVLLAKTAKKVHRALQDEGGAADEFQKAMQSLSSLQLILEHIQHFLDKTDPVFRNALAAQLQRSIGSVSDVTAKLHTKYGKKLESTSSAPTDKFRVICHKTRWALSAAKDLFQFQNHLYREVQHFQLLMLTQISAFPVSSERRLRVQQEMQDELDGRQHSEYHRNNAGITTAADQLALNDSCLKATPLLSEDQCYDVQNVNNILGKLLRKVSTHGEDYMGMSRCKLTNPSTKCGGHFRFEAQRAVTAYQEGLDQQNEPEYGEPARSVMGDVNDFVPRDFYLDIDGNDDENFAADSQAFKHVHILPSNPDTAVLQERRYFLFSRDMNWKGIESGSLSKLNFTSRIYVTKNEKDWQGLEAFFFRKQLLFVRPREGNKATLKGQIVLSRDLVNFQEDRGSTLRSIPIHERLTNMELESNTFTLHLGVHELPIIYLSTSNETSFNKLHNLLAVYARSRPIKSGFQLRKYRSRAN